MEYLVAANCIPFGHQIYMLRGASYVECMGLSGVSGPATVGTLVSRAGPSPFGCQALPCAVTCCLLVGEARSDMADYAAWEVSELVLAHWLVRLGPKNSWLPGPGDPRTGTDPHPWHYKARETIPKWCCQHRCPLVNNF